MPTSSEPMHWVLSSEALRLDMEDLRARIRPLMDSTKPYDDALIVHLFGDREAFDGLLDRARADVFADRPASAYAGVDADLYNIAYAYHVAELDQARAFIDAHSVAELSALRQSGREFTPYERAVLHGDSSDAYRNRHLAAENELVERYEQGLPLSKHDKKRARDIIRLRKEEPLG